MALIDLLYFVQWVFISNPPFPHRHELKFRLERACGFRKCSSVALSLEGGTRVTMICLRIPIRGGKVRART